MLEPRLDQLPPSQRSLWPKLSEVPSGFVLYGGTALTLRLGHRPSEDFDLFANRSFHPDELEREVSFLLGSVRLQSSPNTLVSQVELPEGATKVSFFGGLPLRRVKDPEPAAGNGLLIASLLDLAATKVKVIQDRAEAKDYLDIFRILVEGIDLPSALAAAHAVYGEAFNHLVSLKALSYFGDGDLGTLPEKVRTRLAAAVSSVDPTRLPEVASLPGGLLP
ncbi:MAG TPA: nucleotidyl transferase AbiEii/AbiGii toxin family protein [Thermoanaerobaculia bacterium]|nr:nucleotidyl transferase AbiEii/AbiGii toxin family protein [Thermoanaerobaculia bacterium]